MCEQGRALLWWAVGWCWILLAQLAFHGRSFPWPWAPMGYRPAVAWSAEEAAEARWAWEKQLLGMPASWA